MVRTFGRFGGSYREFDGLFEEFGAERVRDMPVAEAAMVGVGVGAAAAGLRPLVSITYMDFMMLGFDPLIIYGAKLRYKTGGQLTAPGGGEERLPARQGAGSGALPMHRILADERAWIASRCARHAG